MARVQYGSIITELKGKLGGHIFQGGNNAKVIRLRGYTKGSTTTTRSAATSNLQQITSAYRLLTSPQRASWVAAAGNWPFTDKFGNTYFGSGYQMYVAYNRNLVAIRQATVVSPVAPVSPMALGTIVASASATNTLVVGWDNALDGNTTVMCFASPMYPSSVNSNNRRYTFLAIEHTATNTNLFAGTQYVAKYGNLVSGTQIFVKVIVRDNTFPLNNQVTIIPVIVA